MRRLSLATVVAAVALSLSATASSAATPVTIGQLAPESPPQGFADPSGTFDIAQPTVTSGNTYVAPGTGTITSWSHNAAAGAGQTLTFKVFRHLTGSTYMAVGHDGPRSLTGGAVNTFPASIPVKPGDVIGLYFDVAPPAKAYFFDFPGDSFLERSGNLSDGQSGAFVSNPERRVNVRAVFEPTTTSATCKGKPATIIGTSGNDDLTGTDNRDVIAALEGNDKVRGLGGKDRICGGKNKDTLKGGKAKDKLFGQRGRDKLKGGGARDVCKGGKGDDSAAKCEVEKSI
jgi:Ca2+-binding RTX toxin-like protein